MGRLYDMCGPREVSSCVIEVVYTQPPDDYLETVARWLSPAELERESSPCVTIQPGRPVEERQKHTITQIAMAKRDYTDDPRAKEAVRLYEGGMSPTHIARQIEVHKDTVTKMMVSQGYRKDGKRYVKVEGSGCATTPSERR